MRFLLTLMGYTFVATICTLMLTIAFLMGLPFLFVFPPLALPIWMSGIVGASNFWIKNT